MDASKAKKEASGASISFGDIYLHANVPINNPHNHI
jgi:hypothetical protein